jgi:uncharacterized protein
MPFDPRNPDLLIIGASTRAAAHSAVRGGLWPICVDRYGDADLQSVAEVTTVEDFPAGLPAIVERLPACPWMYTGGLENHPRIVARLAEMRPLLGNGSDVLAIIRDPWWLASNLRSCGLPALEVCPRGESSPPPDGDWLRKPIRGAGGRSICVWNDASPVSDELSYFQKYAAGQSYSAQFLAKSGRSETSDAVLLGITRQLIGSVDVGAPPFAWCGSVTPAALPETVVETMRQVGKRLAAEAGLRGLFGCDFVVNGNVPWLTEVNPRYTAAMELLDYELSTSLIVMHLIACKGTPPLPPAGGGSGWGRRTTLDIGGAPSASRANLVRAKRVLFADRDLIALDTTSLLSDPLAGSLPIYADLPNAEQHIPAGQPVCTLYAEEATEELCLTRLRQRAVDFQQKYLREASPPQSHPASTPLDECSKTSPP